MTPPPPDDALIRSLLSEALGTEVELGSIEPLGRGNVWRVGVPRAPLRLRSVIAKREGRDPAGFFDDVAGLKLLSGLGRSPQLLGVSGHLRMLLMTDLTGASVADLLLGSDPTEATSAVLGLAATLGTIHVSTMDRTATYEATRQALGPRRQRLLRHRPSSLPTLLRRLEDAGIAEPPKLRADFATVDDLMNHPGPFLSYIHGDPCPDNTAIGETVRLFDFEWGGVGHALLDGCYLEVPFPTCWCYGRIPEGIVRSGEDLYRRTLAAGCRAADDEPTWSLNLTAASVSWWLAGWTSSSPQRSGRTRSGAQPRFANA